MANENMMPNGSPQSNANGSPSSNAGAAQYMVPGENGSPAGNGGVSEDQAVFHERKRILFFGLPFSFTTYTVYPETILISKGLFNKVEDDAYMYKIVDVRLAQSLWQRIIGIGTIHCYGGDATHPDLLIENVRHSREIKNYIVKQSEKERMVRNTINTMQIDGGARTSAIASGNTGRPPVPPR